MTKNVPDNKNQDEIIAKLGDSPKQFATKVLIFHMLIYVVGGGIAVAAKSGGVIFLLLLLSIYSFYVVLPAMVGAIIGASRERAYYTLAKSACLNDEIYPERVFAHPLWHGALIVDSACRKVHVSGTTYDFEDVVGYLGEGNRLEITTQDGGRSKVTLKPEVLKDAVSYLKAKLGF